MLKRVLSLLRNVKWLLRPAGLRSALDGLNVDLRATSQRLARIETVDRPVQQLLALEYAQKGRRREPQPLLLDDVAFHDHCQNGEDGVLHYVFSRIGITNKKCVEICAGDGIECNTANLIVNHGWHGLLVDGSAQNIERGKTFYRLARDTRFWPPTLVRAWITTETVNAVIRDNGMSGEIDLLSLDLDGNDYWIWEAIDCIQPRVVILEHQRAYGPESVTQRYDSQYVWTDPDGPKSLHGASLAAFVKLGRKGYRLIGSHFYLNAVFLRDGVGDEPFPEVPLAELAIHPRGQFCIAQRQEWEKQGPIEGWVEV